MKKIILLLMLLISSSAFAEKIQWYKTTAYAQAQIYNGTYCWGDWESSNMNISFNFSTEVITIYSPRKQVYRIYEYYNNGNTYTDINGGTNLKFYVIDQDGDRGDIRLRVDRKGTSQIYIDFNDVAWVYNVVKN